MAKQKRLANVKLAKGNEYKGKFPKDAKFMYAEVKKDGLRGFYLEGKLYTASGVLVVNAPQVIKALGLIPKTLKNFVLDGEFFYKNCRTTLGIIKTQTPDHPLRNKLQFFVFDMISRKEWDNKKGTVPLKRRKTNLYVALYRYGSRFIAKYKPQEKPVKMFKATVIKPTDEAVQAFHKDACRRGHEGSMIKDPNSVYAFRKTNDWMKLKPYRESDVKVIAAKEGKGKNKGKLGAVTVIGVIDGKKVKTDCGGGYKDHERVALWKLHKKGKLVGTVIEMTHEGLTVNKAVRFPNFSRVHPEKNQ